MRLRIDNKMPPNMCFQPTASLACARSRRLKRGPLGGLTATGECEE